MLPLNNSALALGLSPTDLSPVEYDRGTVTAGIVHFGVGAFHRSHEAMFIDRLLSQGEARDWGICGVGTLASDARMRDVMAAQDNLYILQLKHPDGDVTARVIGSIVEYLFAPDNPNLVVERLSDPAIRIVSLTVTEAGYSVSDTTGAFDPSPAAIKRDLQPGSAPETVFAIIAEGLRLRRALGEAPFTVMSCDNIPGNGDVARSALVGYATLKDPELGAWIRETVSFPNSMVDRITPGTTDADRDNIALRYDVADAWPVVAESFEQWVLEDKFSAGRPPFESAGVHLVADAAPYEKMKLRLLNASHQAMSYVGLLAGFTYVHEVCQDFVMQRFLRQYMLTEAVPTLMSVPEIAFPDYCEQLITRFASPAVADTLARQVVDASARIPKFLLPVVSDRSAQGLPSPLCALILASYDRALRGQDEQGSAIAMPDSRAEELAAAISRENDDPLALLRLSRIFGPLASDSAFVALYLEARDSLATLGTLATIERYVTS